MPAMPKAVYRALLSSVDDRSIYLDTTGARSDYSPDEVEELQADVEKAWDWLINEAEVEDD